MQIRISGNNHFFSRTGAPGRDLAQSSDPLLILRLRNPREVGTKFRELVKLEYRPAQLEAVAGVVGQVSRPSTDFDLGVRNRFVIKVGLVREGECIGLEIERFGPRQRAPQNKGTYKQKYAVHRN